MAIVERGHAGKAFHSAAHRAQSVAAPLERFLDDKAESADGGTGLPGKVDDAERGVAVSKEVVDEQYAVGPGQEVGADAHGVVAVLGERVYHSREHVFHGFGLLFLDKHHWQVHHGSRHNCRCYAACLDGYNLVHSAVGIQPCKFLANAAH